LTAPYRHDEGDQTAADDGSPADDSAPLYEYEEEEEMEEEEIEEEGEEEDGDDGGDVSSYVVDPVTKYGQPRTPEGSLPKGS
jgi:hypothetical protein